MPARLEPSVAVRATELAADIVTSIDAVGVVAVELFITTDHRVLVNELALRPHNSGHATIEGCVTSQFHNHLRAVLDWPLGAPTMRAPAAAMVNVLGGARPRSATEAVPAALAVTDAAVHLYGKQSRPGRKIGHVTVLDDDPTTALASARRAATALVTP
jgi:5-(carboxyamino)imidazole ribonucleotide synthase